MKDSGIIKEELINVTLDDGENNLNELINKDLFKASIEQYIETCKLWKEEIQTEKIQDF